SSQPPLQLRDDTVHLRQILKRGIGEGAVQLHERPRRREALGPLDQSPLELAAERALEPPDVLAVEAWRGLRRGGLLPKLESAADSLYIDADHARALSLPAECRHCKAREVRHLAV